MAGKTQTLVRSDDFGDPFNAGQMIGMLVMLTFLEKQKHIPNDALEKLKWVCAGNAAVYLNKPTEDVFFIIDNLVKEIEI